MDLTPSLHQPIRTVVTHPALIRGWQVGQVLQATSLNSAAPGQPLNVRIGTETNLQLQLQFQVTAGDILNIRVLALQPRLIVSVEPRTAQARSGSQPTAPNTPHPKSAPNTPVSQSTASPSSSAPSSSSTTASIASAAATAAVARTLMPAQQGLPVLLTLLAAASRQTTLPENVRTAVNQVLKTLLPTANAGNSGLLRQAVRDSGIFFEARLAQAVLTGKAPEGLANDLKMLLLRLKASLPETTARTAQPSAPAPPPPGASSQPPPPPGASSQPPPPPGTSSQPPPPPGTSSQPPPPPGASSQPPPPPGTSSQPLPQARAELPPLTREMLLPMLKQAVEGSLARIGLHQLASAEQPQGTEAQRWLLELPLRNPDDRHDLVHMLIERDGRRDKSGDDRIWSAVLALDLPGLGPITAHVTLGGEKAVSVWFRADAEETAERTRRELPRLEIALAARDLTVTGLGCRQEQVQTPRSGGEGGPASLLDTHA